MHPSESADPIDLVVLAAHRAELADLPKRLAGGSAHAGFRVATAEVGVGLLAAGAGTARTLFRHRPRRALLIGSAGAYPGVDLAPGAVVVATDIHLGDGAVLAGQAALPGPMRTRASTDATLSRSLLSALPETRAAAVATTLGITTDDALARRLGEGTAWQVENLEALAVALACEHEGVPFSALLAITNEVGASGRAQWLAQHRTRAAQVVELTWRWLAKQ